MFSESHFEVFVIFLQRAVTMIPAHDNPLAAIAFNAQGTKIATASEKVRILDIYVISMFIFEPLHKKMNILCMRKQRHRSASQ